MIGSWLVWLTVGVIGTGILGLVATRRGQKRLTRWRGRLFKRATTHSKEAWRGWRNRKPLTPRQQARRARRELRRKQPRRFTFGRRRPPGDPHPVRRGATSAYERFRVQSANRRAARKPFSFGDWLAGARKVWNPGRCGSTDTHDGKPCRNRRMIGKNHCRFHPPTLNRILTGVRSQS